MGGKTREEPRSPLRGDVTDNDRALRRNAGGIRRVNPRPTPMVRVNVDADERRGPARGWCLPKEHRAGEGETSEQNIIPFGDDAAGGIQPPPVF